MNLLLQSLSIENFKGIRQLKLSPNGRSLRIKGKNGMCKTAIFDGFLWLLFGKNSDGKTGFGVKPTFATDGVEPSVTGVFTMDGKLLELGKVLAAKFVKDTGEFKESKTECYINGVKKAPREFEAFIAENLCTEAQFRLLTNPHHFNNSIDWKERRKILFDVCKIGDERNIISQNCAFSPLSEQLERYGSIDEYRTFLRDKKKKISEQINGLPIRIDEAYKQFDGTLDKAKIMADLTTARGHLGALQTELSQAKNTAAIAEIDLLKAEIKKMESANFSYRNEQSLKQTTEKFSAKTTAMTAITNLEREISQTSFELATITDRKSVV